MTPDRERKMATVDRPLRPVPDEDSHPAGTAGLPAAKIAPHGAQPGPPLQATQLAQPAAPEAPPSPAKAAETAETPAKPEPKPALPGTPAREIKLEVADGERRVEVRLSERAGEVRVAVRTADSHLAGSLRENLPELASRFAETGVRSEIWRPASSASGEWRHTTDTPAGNLAQNGDSQSSRHGGDAQKDAQQQHPREFQEQKTHKEKGKDFAWLMSSLR